MSKGILIFATNSTTTDGRILDYVGLASHAARLANKHLDLPVALITADEIESDQFDKIIRTARRDGSKRTTIAGNAAMTYEWHNADRLDALELTPWDRTLVIDADYLVMCDQLRCIVDCDAPFMIAQDVADVTGSDDFKRVKFLPDRTLHQRWATVICFDRSQAAAFQAARMVRENYEYYATMFGWSKQPYRNDYAFTVAAHLLGLPSMPFPMFQLPAFAEIESADERGLRITHNGKVMRWNHDLHILNKSIALDHSVLENLHA